MHPAWMLLSIGLAFLTLRAGLRLRRRRIAKARRTPDLLRAHLRLAKPAVILVLIGFTAGPISAWWLRDWSPFGSFHSWLGLAAASLFATAAVLGRRLEKGRGGAVDRHAAAGGIAVLLAAVAAFAGFVLLP